MGLMEKMGHGKYVIQLDILSLQRTNCRRASETGCYNVLVMSWEWTTEQDQKESLWEVWEVKTNSLSKDQMGDYCCWGYERDADSFALL